MTLAPSSCSERKSATAPKPCDASQPACVASRPPPPTASTRFSTQEKFAGSSAGSVDDDRARAREGAGGRAAARILRPALVGAGIRCGAPIDVFHAKTAKTPLTLAVL